MISAEKIQIKTKGNTDIVDITEKVQEKVNNSNIENGIVTTFISGSTAALTTIEYESGLIKDLKEFFENIIPQNKEYHHNKRWHDGNGHSHLRASLIGPSLAIPFKDKKLLLGTWQQIVLIDFDNRPRQREIVLQIIGE